MAAVAGSDIDSFIREQKAKLATERQALARGTGPAVHHLQNDNDDDYRVAWSKLHPQELPSRRVGGDGRPRNRGPHIADLNRRKLVLQDDMEYRALWEQVHGKRRRAREERPGKGSARVNALNARTAKALEAEDYYDVWQKVHNKKSPRTQSFPAANGRPQSSQPGRPQERHRFHPRIQRKLSNMEYRDLWKEVHGKPQQNTERRSLAHQTDEYKANVSFPGMNESDNAKIQKERERNEEYKQHLREKGQGRRPEATTQQEPEYYATLPGMRDASSAKKRKELQRNAEYNLHLQSKRLPAKTGDLGGPPVTPRRVWATPVPTYEDLLDQKRQQEAQYRRANDPSYDRPLESERKLAELDKELQMKKARFRNEQLSQGVLDDPSWLTPRKRPSDVEYDDLPRRDRRSTLQDNPSYNASLPLGSDFAEYEKKRQQEQYRHDLQKQIREAADGKQREFQRNHPYASNGLGPGEKTMDLSVDYSGYIDPFPAATVATSRRSRQTPVRPYHTTLMESLEKLDQISPRSEVILGRRRLEDFGRGGRLGGALPLNRGTPRSGGVGVIDTGFESLMDTPRLASLDPPPGLQYQPASYITQGGAGGLGQSSVDEAYSFYATRNPLEEAPDGVSGGDAGGAGGRKKRADQELSFAGGGGGGGGGRGARIRFEEEKRVGGGRPMDFPTDEDNKRTNQMKAQAYQEELNRQIEENKRKKMKDREDKERFDRKIEQEAKDYNPYGRGGGGAPMRDSYGNLITDLRSMRHENEEPDSSRRAPNPSYFSPRAPTSIRDDLIGPPPVQTTAEGEQSYARGGHGIFGMPKTDSEKIASEKYKSDLMRQIEDKRYEDMKKREMEREEEAREQRRVEEQQRRMQEEYEEERRRAREKEEEARRKNDELMRLAEERKREAELRKREAEEQRQEEQRRQREAEEAARVNETVEDQPAAVTVNLLEVPADTLKEEKQTVGAQRGDSPPVPAVRTRTEPEPSTSQADPAAPSRAQSADVLNQLAAMRKQLQNERQRVENMLESERNEPDVFDPRLVQRPPPAPVVRPEIDVFETARNRNAAPVHRAPAERPSTRTVEDFSSLKFKDDSDSRKEFRRLFPDQPSSGDTLEAQQAALLRQQEDNLRRLRDQRQYDSGYPKTSVLPPPSRTQSLTPKQLHSDSAFVDVDSVNHFPDDFDDIPTSRRNDSGRARQRDRRDSSPRVGSRGYADPFGSTTSLNVDRLSKKNEDRLKRLREMQGDDMSLYDPDDVLDRFMSKQAHNR